MLIMLIRSYVNRDSAGFFSNVMKQDKIAQTLINSIFTQLMSNCPRIIIMAKY